MHWVNTFVRIKIMKSTKIVFERFRKVGDLEMVKYLEAAECICLAISVCNLIAVGFAMKKQKSIVVLSNLIVWTEGCYVDENNLSGSAITFILNICNIVFFIVSCIMGFKCKKAE